jgi:hypothetical protein
MYNIRYISKYNSIQHSNIVYYTTSYVPYILLFILYSDTIEYYIEVKYWLCVGHSNDCRHCNHITDNNNKKTRHMTISSNNSTQHSTRHEMTTSHLSRAYSLNAVMLEMHVIICSHQ